MMRIICLARRATFVTLACALSANPVFSGGNHHHSHGKISDDSRFTNNKPGGTWPPQPRGRSGEQRFTPAPVNRGAANNKSRATGTNNFGPATKQSRIAAARVAATTKAASNVHARNLLGERYAHIATRALGHKWSGTGNTPQFEVVYFSHSNNQTVKARIDDGDVEQVTTTAAALTQPPLAQVEMDQAVRLARQWWQRQGQDRVGQLAGFAIQTYQDNGSFHPNRMVYVSFHHTSEALPELLTWVDLSGYQIVRAKVSQ